MTSFLYKVEAASSLESKILKLAGDIIALDYDPKTEKSLLNTLKTAYEDAKGDATADTNWDANIKKNKEKKQQIKQKMLERNQQIKDDLKKGRKSFEPDRISFPSQDINKLINESDNKKEIKKRIKNKVKNVISVEFGKLKKEKKGLRFEDEDESFAARLKRVRSSLEKINTLMAELKSESQD